MNRLDIYFAYLESAIYFKPNQHLNDVFEFNISKIILLENKSGSGGFIIKNIAGNSSSLLAGLQKSDEIVRINSYKSESMNLKDAIRLLNKRIEKKITIQCRGVIISYPKYLINW